MLTQVISGFKIETENDKVAALINSHQRLQDQTLDAYIRETVSMYGLNNTTGWYAIVSNSTSGDNWPNSSSP